jgi:hypothetical protein
MNWNPTMINKIDTIKRGLSDRPTLYKNLKNIKYKNRKIPTKLKNQTKPSENVYWSERIVLPESYNIKSRNPFISLFQLYLVFPWTLGR